MLNEIQKKVLQYIRSVSKDGAFKVLDAEDILQAAPELSKADLAVVIKELLERDYILVKFANLDNYCIASSNKAIIEEEKAAIVTQKIIEESSNGAALPVNKKLFKLFLVASFAGGLVGGLVAGLIQLIISLAA